MSAYPKERRALYPLGQQFKVVSSGYKTAAEVCRWLSVATACQAPDLIFVVELQVGAPFLAACLCGALVLE